MLRSFAITEPYQVVQFNVIARILYDYRKKCIIAYTSNWYVTVACIDEVTAKLIQAKINTADDWDIELRPGKKNRYHYLQIKLKQGE